MVNEAFTSNVLQKDNTRNDCRQRGYAEENTTTIQMVGVLLHKYGSVKRRVAVIPLYVRRITRFVLCIVTVPLIAHEL